MSVHETRSGPGFIFSEHSPRPNPAFSTYSPPSSLPHTQCLKGASPEGTPEASSLSNGAAAQQRQKPGFPFPVCSAQQSPLPRQTQGGRAGLRPPEMEGSQASFCGCCGCDTGGRLGLGRWDQCLSSQQGLLGTQLPGNREGGLWDPERVSLVQRRP